MRAGLCALVGPRALPVGPPPPSERRAAPQGGLGVQQGSAEEGGGPPVREETVSLRQGGIAVQPAAVARIMVSSSMVMSTTNVRSSSCGVRVRM